MAGARLQQRLLSTFLVLLLGALVPAAVLLDRWLQRDVSDSLENQLAGQARLIAAQLERDPPADIDGWVRKLPLLPGVRVSVIAADGRVVGDSDVAPVEHMENHRTRPEVVQALEGRVGTSVRRSVSFGRELLYVAVPSGQPISYVVRMALTLDEVRHTVGRAQSAIWLAGLSAFALALLLGLLLARWLSRPIIAMTRAARAMSHGDFEVALPDARDDELGDLQRALDTLRSQLASRLDELRAEGTKLRTILNGMTEGVALVQDGVITVANPAFGRLLGAQQVEGRGPMEAARLPELAEVVELASLRRREATREAQVSGRTLQLKAHPLGAEGARQAVLVLLDTTETRRLERLRRDFVANASHELRTPVAAILGVAETLTEGAADDPEARASFIDILSRHARRLSRLTADLLDIARLEGGYKPRVEIVAVYGAVDTVVATLKPRAEEKQIALGAQVPADLTLQAERAAVEQILTNLIDNAIKYTPEGGRVTVTAERKGEQVQLAVEDTGPGIPEEHHVRLFERFYRVDSARSRELGGTGLGLSIVKHLALANGGDVRVESTVGKGSRFIVILPRA